MKFGTLTNPSSNRVAIYPTDISGGSVIYSTTVDFGTPGVRSKTFTITNTGVTTSQNVIIAVSAKMPGGLSIDELEMEPISVSAYVSSTNTITIIASARGKITKQRTFNYQLA